MVASVTPLPVIGVPVPLKHLDGMDSLLSIVQMPAGVPVATVSIGGARNAGLLAVRILGAADPALRDRMAAYQAGLERAGGREGRRAPRHPHPHHLSLPHPIYDIIQDRRRSALAWVAPEGEQRRTVRKPDGSWCSRKPSRT